MPTLFTAQAVVDASGRRGDAVLVDGERIVAVGDAGSLRHPGMPEEVLSGVLVPGLRDAHFHPVGYAASLRRPSLKNARSLAEVSEILQDACSRQPPGTAITALRLDDTVLEEGRLPDRYFLDGVVPDHPALLVRYCGHVAVANTRSLDIAGIGPDTPDPEGGSLDRDQHGPTGVLRETAVSLITRALQPLAPALDPVDVTAAAAGLVAVGLTGIGAIVSMDEGLWAGGAGELDLLLAAAADIPLTLRVLVIAKTPDMLKAAADTIGTSSRVSFLGLKAFSDGSLGGHTAALREPYADKPTTGTHRLDPDWADKMIHATHSLGGKVAIHAIGDAAAGRVLDTMERAIDQGVDPADLRMEHASVLADADIERLGRLGVTACVQPAFLASEKGWLEDRLGSDRLSRTYAFRSLADAGVPLAGGSDCPVEPPHPLWGMALARHRCGIVPRQALSAAEALALFTTGASSAIAEDARLDPGLPATFTVLGGNPLEATPKALHDLEVSAVYVAGKRLQAPPDIKVWMD
jgi:predicted amidohydrolase YtcJ